MWKSSSELDAVVSSLPNISGLKTLYGLSVFWRRVIGSADYKASEEWNAVLRLTHQGEATLKELRFLLTGFEEPDVLLAFFEIFSYHDIFFDHERSDSTGIRQILERELREERVRLPYQFGRVLYDRFNDTYWGTRPEHLMGPEVEQLLQGTPIGVSQLGRLISGPLGIIDSEETRFVPPTRNLPLWHCSDTGCSAVHVVHLNEPRAPVVDAYSRISSALYNRLGPPIRVGPNPPVATPRGPLSPLC